MLDPNRTKLRIEHAEPKQEKSNTETQDPSLAIPYRERLEPNLAKLRIDKLDPSEKQSRRLREEPK
jgi:hypothetical protein